ncbi:hypothetical protein ACLI08_05685 [Flavobacterium sp. RNTU_13]|uniref:hypothetical protein n=1 Tax=Flavobacterium sp. RNTU_13 TaxID=3375145 RepID=UPI0039871BF9
MKEYFKYKYGYINVDDENLYLTNSGNWQEARETEEKSRAIDKRNSVGIVGMKIFVYVVLGAICIFVLKNLGKPSIGFGVIGLAIFLGYRVYKVFSKKFGSRYRIPLQKITNVSDWGTVGLRIDFLNANNEPDFEIIEELDFRGRDFLLELKTK